MLPIEKAVLAIAMTILVTVASCAHTTRAAMPEPYRVIDGDTLEVQGKVYRMAWYDTPETFRPRCSEEAIKGAAATSFFRALISNPSAQLIPLGTLDVYGRELAEIVVEKTQVYQIMIDARLALPYSKRARHRPDWCSYIRDLKKKGL